MNGGKKARVFALDKLFQLSVMYASKAGAYPSEAPTQL